MHKPARLQKAVPNGQPSRPEPWVDKGPKFDLSDFGYLSHRRQRMTRAMRSDQKR